MGAECYDIIVIGAGINGAGVAQAAAAAGYRTLVLEQNANPGMETSSRSSKLVHGGLRYLESFEISLVRESLQERELLLRLAPELVHMTRFNIPLYWGSRRHASTLRAGLSLYAILAGLKKQHLYRRLKPGEWAQLDGLTRHQLKAVFQYQDAQTDDQALTRAVIQSALNLGAELRLNAHFVEGRINNRGVETVCQQGDNIYRVKARALVNASGPWVDDVLQQIYPVQSLLRPDLVQGTHLVLKGAVNQAYYLEAPQDGRAVFVLPWKGHSLLGTTEKIYRGEPSSVTATGQERAYLLEVYRHYFPSNDDQVIAEMAGCRVLPAATGSLFKRSRETQFAIDNHHKPRLVSIIGGKLTVYRRTALKALDYLEPVLGPGKQLADTGAVRLDPVDKLNL